MSNGALRGAWIGALAAAVAVLQSGGLAAQSDAASGAPVLRLAPSPRAVALGETYAAGAPEDPFALFYNPAGIGGRRPPAEEGRGAWSVAAAYREHVGDAAAGAFAARFRGLGGAGGVGIRYIDYGAVEELVPDPAFGGQVGTPTGGTVRGTEVALGAAYALDVGPVSVGAGFDMVRTDIADLQDVGVGVSAGFRAAFWDGRIGLGAAAQHLGADAGPGTDAPLPRTYRAGASIGFGGDPVWIRFSGDASGPDDRLRPSGGLELRLAGTDGVAVVGRAGWDGSVEDGDALEAFSYGAGVVLGPLSVDYAYRSYGVLGAAHQLGVRYAP